MGLVLSRRCRFETSEGMLRPEQQNSPHQATLHGRMLHISFPLPPKLPKPLGAPGEEFPRTQRTIQLGVEKITSDLSERYARTC